MNVGIEHLLDLPFDLTIDEDESAGGKMVVRGLDKDGIDDLYGEAWVGSEFEEVGGCREGSGIGATAGEEEGTGGAVTWRTLIMINLRLIEMPILGYVLGCGCGYGC